MNRSLLFLITILPSVAAWASSTINPPSLTYTPASIVNAASYLPDALAPNTIATVFGTNLAFATTAVSGATLQNGGLPPSLGGVTVYVDGGQSGLYYVSPNQINFLIPNHLHPGTVPLQIARDGFAGPEVMITLQETAPALFADTSGNAIATHLDGSLLTSSAPASPGEWVILYCLGLGRTVPDSLDFSLSQSIAPILDANFALLALTLNSQTVNTGSQINYAGMAPGYAGLYQINLQIPESPPSNPQIMVSIGPSQSAPNVKLFVAAD